MGAQETENFITTEKGIIVFSVGGIVTLLIGATCCWYLNRFNQRNEGLNRAVHPRTVPERRRVIQTPQRLPSRGRLDRPKQPAFGTKLKAPSKARVRTPDSLDAPKVLRHAAIGPAIPELSASETDPGEVHAQFKEVEGISDAAPPPLVQMRLRKAIAAAGVAHHFRSSMRTGAVVDSEKPVSDGEMRVQDVNIGVDEAQQHTGVSEPSAHTGDGVRPLQSIRRPTPAGFRTPTAGGCGTLQSSRLPTPAGAAAAAARAADAPASEARPSEDEAPRTPTRASRRSKRVLTPLQREQEREKMTDLADALVAESIDALYQGRPTPNSRQSSRAGSVAGSRPSSQGSSVTMTPPRPGKKDGGSYLVRKKNKGPD